MIPEAHKHHYVSGDVGPIHCDMHVTIEIHRPVSDHADHAVEAYTPLLTGTQYNNIRLLLQGPSIIIYASSYRDPVYASFYISISSFGLGA